MKILVVSFISIALLSCGEQQKENNSTGSVPLQDSIVSEAPLREDYSDALVMNGNGIMGMFRDFSANKQWDEMLRFTSGTIVARYGEEKVRSFYAGLDLTQPLIFENLTDEGDVKVLNYRVTGKADEYRKLRVVEENDTVRVWPFDFEKGLFFSGEK
ncbi:MAG: hypothetical protein ACK40M_08615 [Flavobacteriales bacterium]